MELTRTKTGWTLSGEKECGSCRGTGLYQGIAERDGAAVVCHSCKGKGCVFTRSTYGEFKGRKIKEGIKRVFDNGGGYVLSDQDVTTKEGDLIEFSKYGASYEEWFNNDETPKPLENLLCPYQHTHQGVQRESHQANKLYQERCKDTMGFGLITSCPNYGEKGVCWKRYKELTGE